MSLLLIFEILGILVNTLTTDERYSLRNSEKLPQPIHMQLCNEQIIFPQFLVQYLKLTSN